MKTLSTLLVAAALVGCGPKATPVTPAPLSAEAQAKLDAELRGTWRSTHIKEGAKERTAETSFQFTFAPDGKMQTVIYTSMANVANVWTYSLDGKNIKTDSMFGTLRADAVTPGTLELFSYETSTVYFVTRR
jgi:hypothetical protein